ncbi:hypothetical protein [Nonomuraea sp. NPDC003727]
MYYDDHLEEAAYRSRRQEQEWSWQRQSEASRGRLTDEWPTLPRTSGSFSGLFLLVMVVCAGLAVAAGLGYSPAEVWAWVSVRVERLVGAWLNG